VAQKPRPQPDNPREQQRPAHARPAEPSSRPGHHHQSRPAKAGQGRGGAGDAGASLAGLGFLSTRRRARP
jgi:hypothetical protein